MSARILSVEDAYRRLGLEPGAGLAAAKSAFRAQVKSLHPDTAPATPQTLAQLAGIVAAIRTIESSHGDEIFVEITHGEARRGVTRAVRSGTRSLIVRIPPGAAHGDRLEAVGAKGQFVTCVITESDRPDPIGDRPREFDALSAFIEEFSSTSAASRFARWIRESGAPDSSAA